MSHSQLYVAAIQPSCPRHPPENEAMQASAWKSAAAAADRGATLIVLPEYFNVMGLPEEAIGQKADQASLVRRAAARFCRQHRCWLLLPLIESRGNYRFNASHLVNPDGDTVFTYDKTHLTLVERHRYGLTAGNALDVIRTPFGVIGVMTCYDVYFPEVAHALALRGARIILFPTTQRSESEDTCMLLNRVRAIDSVCYLIRASYGMQLGDTYQPGMAFGGSCIVAPDGSVLANAGRCEATAEAVIAPAREWLRPRCHGAQLTSIRSFLSEDRRPDLYSVLAHASAS